MNAIRVWCYETDLDYAARFRQPPPTDCAPRGGIARAGIGHMNNNTLSNQRPLLDPKTCRTRFLGETLDFSQCLVKNPDACRYAARVVSNVFCRHPDRRSFEKTGPL